jgi:hypothetical protein
MDVISSNSLSQSEVVFFLPNLNVTAFGVLTGEQKEIGKMEGQSSNQSQHPPKRGGSYLGRAGAAPFARPNDRYLIR